MLSKIRMNHLFIALPVAIIILFFISVLFIWKSDDMDYDDIGTRRYNYDIYEDEDTMSKETVNEDNRRNVIFNLSYPVISWMHYRFTTNTYLVSCRSGIKCQIDFSNMNASAYLFHGNYIDFQKLPLPRNPETTIWGIFQDDSPRITRELMHEKILNLFNYSSTFSRYSNVPFPLKSMQMLDNIIGTSYFVETATKNKHLNKIAPVMYLQSDCDTATERDQYVGKLMEFIRIDSYGSCLKNNQLPRKFRYDFSKKSSKHEFQKFVARYKFILTIENGVCDDYITDKFWRAIHLGSVPIYFGSPTIRDWLPNNKSAILIDDYPTPKLLGEHLAKLMRDDKLYEEYLDHKIKGTITNSKMFDELRKRPYQTDIYKHLEEYHCLICQKVHDLKKTPKSYNVVDRRHYNCPMPISVLNRRPEYNAVVMYDYMQRRAQEVYDRVLATGS